MTISRRILVRAGTSLAILILAVTVWVHVPNTRSAAEVVSDALATATTTTAQDSNPTSAPPPTPVLASHAGSDSLAGLRADLRSVKRSNRLVTVNFSISVLSTSGPLTWKIQDKLGSARSAAHEGPDDLSGITMTDGVNGKLYPVVRDQQGNCVCSRSLLNAEIDNKGTANFFATFGAPPIDVRAVDINVPLFGTFSNVPLS